MRDVRFGAHPLHLASALGDVGMIRLIISKGAFVQARCSGSEDLIEALTAAAWVSARPGQPSPGLTLVNMHPARCTSHWRRMCPKHPKQESDPPQATSWSGHSPVHAAAAQGHVLVLTALLAAGAAANAATPRQVPC